MNKRLRRFIIALPILAVFVTLLWTGSNPSASASKSQAQQAERVSATPPGQATAPQATAQQAMTVSTPRVVNWQQISQLPSAGTLRPGRAGAEIESDIDPATMQILKKRPYTAPSVPTPSRKIQEDPAAKTSGSAISPLAPNLVNSFESIDDADQIDGFLHRPPDCAMAAGPNHVMAAVNSMFVIYTKGGTNVGQASFANFYSPVCSSCSPFDPRVAYDTTAGRWLLLVVNGGPSTPGVSNYLLAASQTSDPTGNWWLYSLTGVLNYNGTDTWADFPQLGFDGIAPASGGAVYITSNQFTFGGSPSFRTAKLNILPKSSLYGGAGLNYWRAWDRLNSNGSQAFTLSPASMYGNNGGEYMVNTSNGGNFVSLWRVVPTFPPTAVNWTLQSTQSIGTYNIPPDAAQPGNCELMATNDSRISSGSVWRNNHLNAAFTESFDWGGGGGTVAAIRYIQINTSSNTTDFNLTYGADGLHYFFPAVATDSSENVVLTFARAGSSEFGSIRHTGRLVGETSLQGSALLKSGNLCITGGRWGDYFSAAVDPADGSRVWIYGAWAADVLGVSLPWDWGTWIGQVTFGTVCTYSINPTSQSFPAVGGTGSVSVTAGTGCTWTAVSNNPWIIVNSGSSGTGNGTVTYTVLANPFTSPDVGTITIAGQTFTVNQAANSLPTISAVGVTRQQGSPSSNSTIANVSDANQAANTLSVTVNGSSSATVNGVTVSGISISAGGIVTANVVASCSATTAGFTLTVTDNASATASATLTVTVTANSAPVLSYSNQSVALGGALTINPASGPSDNGTVSSIIVQSQGTYTGSISVNNSTGVISISGAAPAGTHTITIRATDNCGATTNASFTLTVSGSCIAVSVPTNLTGGQGSIVTVPINVGNLTGQGVVSYDFTLTFNSSVLTPASPAFDAAGTLSNGLTVTPNTSTPGQITVSAFGINALSGSGTLLNLRFNVVGAPNSTTGLNFSLFRFNEGTPCSTTSNGFFTVQNNFSISGVISYCIANTKKVANVVLTTIGAPPLSGTSNSSGNYTISNIPGGAVTVTPAKTGDVNGISSFDASQVAQASAGLITLTSCQQVAADASNNGSVSSFDASQIAQFAAGLPVNPPNVTGTWKFVPANRLYNPLSSNLSNENYDAVLVGDVSGNWTSPTGPSGNTGTTVQIPVTLPNLSTKAGSSVTVPVKVGNFGTSRIVSYDFEIEFDPSVLQLLDSPVDVAGTLSDAFTITPNPAAGRLRVSGFGLARLEGSGTLLNLKFNVVGAPGASSALTWRGFAFNEDAQSNLTGGGVIIAPSNGLQYYPLARSVRLLDTRPGESGCFVPGAPLGDGMVLKQSAVGACSGIPANAVAVVGNATAVNFISTGPHWITFYPSNEQRPNTSNLNFRDNQVMSNWFTARLGADGAFNIYSHASTHLVIDVAGYYAPPEPKGLYYHPLPASVRLFDSRSGANACDAPGNPLANNGIRTVKAHGTCFNAAIPASAQAIVGSATAINFLSSGFNWATLYASGDPVPKSSSLNFTANEVVSNWFTAKLSGDGKFNIYSRASTHFVIDVAGYFSNEPVDENGMGLLYHPLAKPVRLLDTRSGGQACNAPGIPLEGYGIASLTARGTCLGETIPDSAKAIEGSATAVNFLSTGFNWITLYPFGTPQPNLSSLNFTANQIVLNWFTVGLSNDGKVSVYSQAPTHLILDLTGYFAR